MPPTKPLTDAERRQLVSLDKTHGRGYGRFVATMTLLGAAAGAVLILALVGPRATSLTFAETYPALAPVEAAVGPTAFAYLVSMGLFAGGMAVTAWLGWAVMMGTRNRLHARDLATGRSEPPAP